MNERMLELYKQAQVPYTAIDPTNNMPYETTVFSADKFAQLIVKECAAYLNCAMEVYTQSEQDLYDRGATKIKQHFGVEE